MTTICAKCCHFVNRGDIWYDKFCGHPVVQREKCINVVTGEPGYRLRNDLGRVVPTSEPLPFARDVNDGECDLWEEAGTKVQCSA